MRFTLIAIIATSALIAACDNGEDNTSAGGIPEISEKKRAIIEARPDPEQADREEARQAAEAEERAERAARQNGG